MFVAAVAIRRIAARSFVGDKGLDASNGSCISPSATSLACKQTKHFPVSNTNCPYESSLK
jgi:hypothetical protein